MSSPDPPHDPGSDAAMTAPPDYGETTYRGTGRLQGRAALITGADSGIGKAVALAFAREGADVAISYLDEHDDAAQAQGFVTDAGRRALLLPGDLADPAHCREIVGRTVAEFGRLDILVSNAAFQRSRALLEDVTEEEWDYTWATNVSAYFHLVKAAVPHLKPGASIIATSSVQSDQPAPTLLPYAATKAALANMTASLAQLLGDRGIRANTVAPGPIWTPLVPATMPAEALEGYGEQTPLARPGQPAELAPVYVLLASDDASYISGAVIPVTGGSPML